MSEQKFYEVLVVCNDEYMYFRVKAFDEDDAEMKVYYGDWVNEYTDEEIENSFRQRELSLKQSQITSSDLANSRSSDIADKKANAEILNSLKNE